MSPRSAASRVGWPGEAWTEAAWLATVTIVPLHFAFFAHYAFENHKVALLRAGVATACAGWLVGRWERGRGRSWRARITAGTIAAPLVVVGCALLSTSLSLAPWVSLWGTTFRQQGLVTLLCYVLLFLVVVDRLREPARWERLLDVLILASLPVCLYALAQRLGVDPVPWGAELLERRNAATLGNPVFLGAYAAMILFPTLGRMLAAMLTTQGELDTIARSQRRAVGYGLLALLQLAALLGSGSRGPALAALVGALAFAVCVVRGARPTAQAWRNAAAVLGILAVGLGAGSSTGLLAAALLGVWNPATLGAGATAGALLALLGALGLRGSPVPRRAAARSCLLAALLPAAFLGLAALAWSIDAERAPRTPLRSLRDTVGHALERSATARNRVLFWQAYRDAFVDPAALRYAPESADEPTGRVDRLHRLRPWIGYGPEVAGELFRGHYAPELAEKHGLGATADRAHDEAWDRLLGGGIVGLAAWLWLWIGWFQHGLGAAGFRSDARRRRRLARIVLSVSALLAAVAALLTRATFFGPGLQIGLIVGLLGQLAFGARLPPGRLDGRRLACQGLLVGMLVHLAETTVGFGVTATRLQLWMFAALLVCPAAVARRPSSDEARRRERATGRGHRTVAAIGGLLLGGVAFAFLGPEPSLAVNAGAGTGAAGRSALDALIALRPPDVTATPLFYVGMILLTWIWSCHLLPPGPDDRASRTAASSATRLGAFAPLALALLLLVAHRWRLDATPGGVGGSVDALCTAFVESTRLQAARVTLFYLWLAVATLLLARSLMPRAAPRLPARRSTRWIAAALAVALVVLIARLAVRPARADVWSRGAMRARAAFVGEDRSTGSRLGVPLQWRAAVDADSQVGYWLDLAELASTGALDRRGESSGPLATVPPQRACDFDRTQLFLLALDAVEQARRVQPATALLPLEQGHVYARWYRATDEPRARENRRRLALARYRQAETMFGGLSQVAAFRLGVEREAAETDVP